MRVSSNVKQITWGQTDRDFWPVILAADDAQILWPPHDELTSRSPSGGWTQLRALCMHGSSLPPNAIATVSGFASYQ